MLLLIPVPRAKAAEAPADALASRLARAADSSHGGRAPDQAPRRATASAGALTSHAQGSVFKAATDVVTDLGRVRNLGELRPCWAGRLRSWTPAA